MKDQYKAVVDKVSNDTDAISQASRQSQTDKSKRLKLKRRRRPGFTETKKREIALNLSIVTKDNIILE